MFGLGKPRTRLGRFLDDEDISQEEIISLTGISKNTVTQICNEKDYRPQENTMKKVIKALKREGFDVEMDDFWDEYY